MKRLTGIAALIAALSCGDSTSSRSVPCSSDAECKAGRKCVEGYCESGSETVDDDSSTDPCADSPLTGKYLVRVWGCDMYSVVPFANCEGTLKSVDERSRPPIDVNQTVSYEGNRIHYPAESFGEDDEPAGTITLIKTFSDSQIVIDEACLLNGDYDSPHMDFTPEKDTQELRCILSQDTELYLGVFSSELSIVELPVCPNSQNIFKLVTTPIPNKEACEEQYYSPFESIVHQCYNEVYGR